MTTTEIKALLTTAQTIAVVGLSNDPFRPSHEVGRYLKDRGYRIIPVNPKESEVLGETSYARLEDIREPVDIVDIFRRSELVPEVVDAAIAIGAKAVWMQQGVIHEESAAKALAAGLQVVMDRCILIDHQALLRTPPI